VAERKSFLMRIDPALWRELERWAADDLRSVNGQVEYILREALRRRGVRVGGAEGSDAAAPDAAAPDAAAPHGDGPHGEQPEQEPR
jgi:hypothetical protein